MMLYHGGTDIIETPDIRSAVPGRDFGAGFYLTGIQDQAEKWARRQASESKDLRIILWNGWSWC